MPGWKRRKRLGWVVMISDRRQPKDRRAVRCQSEAQARTVASLLNAMAGDRCALYYAEYWQTSSTIGADEEVPTDDVIEARRQEPAYSLITGED